MGEFNDRLVAEYRATQGRVGGPYAGADLLLLTTVGAKSGQVRVTPLTFHREGGRYYIFASYAGAPVNPAWYHNLKTDPDVLIEVGAEAFEVRAREILEPERDAIYARHAELYPLFVEYEKKTSRLIPVIALEPR